jgi:hypothetical protein
MPIRGFFINLKYQTFKYRKPFNEFLVKNGFFGRVENNSPEGLFLLLLGKGKNILDKEFL